jgi:hypothetical protein
MPRRAAEIRSEDLRKYPHLAKLLGEETKLPADNAQTAYTADDEIIPKGLWEQPPTDPVIVVHVGHDRIVSASLAIALACLLVPIGIILGVLSLHAPALLVGILVGVLLAYGLSHWHESGFEPPRTQDDEYKPKH